MLGELLGEFFCAANRQLSDLVEIGVNHIQPAAKPGQQA